MKNHLPFPTLPSSAIPPSLFARQSYLRNRIACLLTVATGSLLWSSAPASAEPKPGDVYKEVVVKATYFNTFTIVSGSKSVHKADDKYKNLKFRTPALDLEGVKKVEVRVEMLSGVEKLSGRRLTNQRMIRFNGTPWVKLADNPLPNDRALAPKKDIGEYATFIYSTTEIPLADLKAGANDFEFDCDGGDEALFLWWATTIRMYYDPATPAPKGTLVSPAAGQAIGDAVEFKVNAASPNGAITCVDYLGCYEDFNYTRDGIHQNWQFTTYRGALVDHIGTAVAAPFAVTWNTEWVPDQTRPMKFMARLTDEKGFMTLTPVVEGLTLSRTGKSVRLYKAFDIAPSATAFSGTPIVHQLDEIKEDLTKARDAKGYAVSNNGSKCSGVYLNNVKVADTLAKTPFIYEARSMDIPLAALKPGATAVRIESSEIAGYGPGATVTWPPLEIKVRYEGIEPLKPVSK